jgi:RND superfamily putative drug exporter
MNMMRALGQFIVKRRWWVVSAWVVIAILVVALSPSISSIESNNQSSFLPSKYESVQAEKIAAKVSSNSQAATDIIVFENNTHTALSAHDQELIRGAVNALSAKHISRVASIATSTHQLAPNKKVQLATVTYQGQGTDTPTIDAVKNVRSAVNHQLAGTDLHAGVTGSEAISYDTQASANKALAIVGIGTILLVLILPAFIFKSPLAGLLPVFAVGIVYSIATALISDAGHLFKFSLSQQLSILFTVVLFGIGTDYILFLLFRYRERLRTGDHTRAAVAFALGRAGEAILSAALVVLSSFAALFFADFGIFRSLAPGLVISVVVMMLAALTFVPALVAIIGPKVFWPSKAWMIKSEKPTYSKRIGGLIARRPGSVTFAVVAVLAILGFAALNFKADFSSFSQPPKGTPSAAAYNDLTAAFPAGTLNPTQVYISSTTPMTIAQLQPLHAKLAKTSGVSSVLPTQLTGNKKIAVISLILKNDPYSSASINNVKGPIRTVAHSFDSSSRSVYVGGATSAIADVQTVTDRDLRVIFPIAGAFIFIILAILLRSLVAPLFLLFCVSLGYIATLGTATFIFETLGHSAGLISFIPLFMYIFVVAIGTDYNILTITRLREEIGEGHKPRIAADLTVEHSSATVASAGFILAATFGSLTLGGISFLTQMGTSIALGVALAAFVIAPFLIPSLSALLGYAIWWPGHRPSSHPPRPTRKAAA